MYFIPYADEVIRHLGKFAFVALHLLSSGGRHTETVAELLCFIKRLEELHTKVQGMITFLHLTTALIFDLLRRWFLYLNRCVTTSSLENVVAVG